MKFPLFLNIEKYLKQKGLKHSCQLFFVLIIFLGATSSKETHDILYARQKIIVTAKAFGLQAIDLVYIDFHDEDGLRRQSREGASMGFTGTTFCQCRERMQILFILNMLLRLLSLRQITWFLFQIIYWKTHWYQALLCLLLS